MTHAPVTKSRVVTCILNGAAHSNRAQEASGRLTDLFAQHGAQARVVMASRGDSVTDFAKRAVEEGSALIVAGGGDGTVNGVAAALIGTQIALGVLPLGTLNHFARDLKIPLGLEAAVANIVGGRVARIDVGCVNDRPFLNNSSLGLYPSIVRQREEGQRRGHGKWVAFTEATVFALRRYSQLYVNLQRTTQYLLRDETPFVFVGNNRYEATGLNIGKRLHLNEGRLWAYTAPRATRLMLLRLAMELLVGRKNPSELRTFCSEEFWIGSRHKRLDVAMDGEVRVLNTPLHYRCLPQALGVIVPIEAGLQTSQ